MRTGRNFVTYIVSIVTLVAILLASLSVQAFAYGEELPIGCVAYANVDTELNMRDQPQGRIIGGVRKGETVTILSEMDRNGYYYVLVNKTQQKCYVYGAYLKYSHTPSDTTVGSPTQVPVSPNRPTTTVTQSSILNGVTLEEGMTLVVTSEKKLNLRKGASRKADRIMYLTYGDKLQVVSPQTKNGYLKVRTSNGKVGHVDIDFVMVEQVFDSLGMEVIVPMATIPPCCECSTCDCACHY